MIKRKTFNLQRLIREVNILLISDLHYDCEKQPGKGYPTALEINEILVEGLPEEGSDLEPDIVIVAGDLVNLGKAKGYKYYFDLLRKLVKKYPNLKNSIFSTPGNHDINRENIVASYNYLFSTKKRSPKEKFKNSYTSNDIINTIYTVSQYDLNSKGKEELIEYLGEFEKEYFKTYLEMDNRAQKNRIVNQIAKIKPLENISTVYVVKDILGINLASINSSFFCNFSNTQNDRNNLFYIKELIGETTKVLQNCTGPVITFMHHPFYYMHESEFIYPLEVDAKSDSNNFNKIADESDILLSGHVHGELHAPSVIHQKAYSITNGTTFTNDTWAWKNKCFPLTYALITVNKQLNKFQLKSYKYHNKNKARKFRINNDTHADSHYAFQPRKNITESNSELEKVKIIRYFSSLAKPAKSRISQFQVDMILNQLNIYENCFGKDMAYSKIKIPGNQKRYQSKLTYFNFIATNKKKYTIICIDSNEYFDLIFEFFNSKKFETISNSSKIYFAIDIEKMLVGKGKSLSDNINSTNKKLSSFLMSSKFHFCSLNFIYY